MESTYEAFFSYSRTDDAHDQGALTDLRKALQREIEAQTGLRFTIFQDRTDILAGQRWRQRIVESIDSSTLLIAALSPSFMRSDDCRDEVHRFIRREEALGRDDLIIPIYYIDLKRVSHGPDPLLDELLERQYHDWRELRFESLTSRDARRKLAQIAGEIAERIREPVAIASPEAHPEATGDDGEEEVGFLEVVAEAEDAMGLFPETLGSFSSEVDRIGEIASNADFDSASRGPRPTAGRLALVRQLAADFEEPAERMERAGIDYEDQLQRVDAGIRALAAWIPELESQDDIDTALDLHRSLSQLNQQAGTALDKLAGLKETMSSVLRVSSTLRPVFNRMFGAMDRLYESKPIFADWENEIRVGLEQRLGHELAEEE